MNVIRTVFASLLLSLLLAGGAFASDKVNINTADAAALEQLTNIGPAKAEAIVAYRKANGAFKSVEQLALVKGIGLRTVELNRDRIELGSTPARRTVATPAGNGDGRRSTQQR